MIFIGKAPFGYRWNEESKKIEINPEEAEVYKKIVSLYVDDGLSMKAIGIQLKEQGIRCKRSPFNSSTLSYILKGSRLAGPTQK
jgi:hypothetical protein